MQKGVTLQSFLQSVDFLKTHSIAFFRRVTTSLKCLFIIWAKQIKHIDSYLRGLKKKKFLELFCVEK